MRKGIRMRELKKLMELKGWRHLKEGSGRQNRWQHCSPSDTVPDRKRGATGRVGTLGDQVTEISSGPGAADPGGGTAKGF